MELKEAVLLSMEKWLWLFKNHEEPAESYYFSECFKFNCPLCEIFIVTYGDPSDIYCSRECVLFPKKEIDLKNALPGNLCVKAYHVFMVHKARARQAAAHIYCILRRFALKHGWEKEVLQIQKAGKR